jgi:hypothetical protein
MEDLAMGEEGTSGWRRNGVEKKNVRMRKKKKDIR